MAQQFHKFRAESLEQAYRAMRRKLGEHALVVRTTTVTEGGVMGIGARRLYEVTAAAPESEPEARPISSAERKYRDSANSGQSPVGDAKKSSEPADFAATKRGLEYFEQLVRDAQERMGTAAAAKTNSGQKQPKPAQAQPQPAPTDREIFEPLVNAARPSTSQAPDAAFRGTSERVPPGRAQESYAQPARSPEEAELRAEIAHMRDLLRVLVAESPAAGTPPEFAGHYRALVEGGMKRELAAKLIGDAADCEDRSVLRDPQVVEERLKFRVRRLLRTTGGIKLTPGKAHLVAFVGPTGVGKTTNLAKLAASFAVTEHAKVGLITADTYRVAATDQLRVYANIIGLDMRIVKTPNAAQAAREAFAGLDLILMDTAGGSPFNGDQMMGVKAILEAARPDEVMLLASAGTPYEDLKSIHDNFAALNPSSLLFTKLDETRRYGGFLSLAAETAIPLSYFSIGQNVPDDIVAAHGGMVADMIMEDTERRGRTSTKSA